MRFEVLGPLTAIHDGETVPLGGSRQRVVLAALLTEPGQPVSAERLIDAVWGERPPATARKQLQTAVWRLRGSFEAHGEGDRLLTAPHGYTLRLQDDELDASRFTRLLEQAVDAEDDKRVALLRQALDLWHGIVAFADLLEVPLLAAASRQLTDRRLSAAEQLYASELELGRHREVIPELAGEVAAYPQHERLVELYMLALYRCGRQGDALTVFRAARQILHDELGIEPGPALQSLQRAILDNEAWLDAPAPDRDRAPSPPPRQLPAATSDFTGRDAELLRLTELALPADRDQSPTVVAVTGLAGVGKTALVLRWGQRHRADFPDGQLYVDLHGYDDQPPVQPLAAMTGLLRALGIADDRQPLTADDAAALLRTLLTDRRVLVVLDNARSAQHVRPLVAAAPCTVIVTSRNRMDGLVARQGAVPLELEPLRPEGTAALLRRVLGDDRVDAERDAAARLAEYCGHLPLAVRIAAADLLATPQQTIAAQVASMDRDVLAGLEIEDDPDAAVLTAFNRSYASLGERQRRLFRLLAPVPGRTFTADAAAALTGLDRSLAARELHGLAAAHMVMPCGAERFTFHDLLRRYARRLQQSAEADAGTGPALNRLLDWYVQTTYAAGTMINRLGLRPERPASTARWPVPFTAVGQAWTWLEAETENLVATVTHAAQNGPEQVAWELVTAIPPRCWHAGNLVGRLRMCQPAGEAAARAGDLVAVAAVRRVEGLAYSYLSDHTRSVAALESALEAARRAGWNAGEAMILSDLGVRYEFAGAQDRGAEHLRSALAVARRADDRRCQATVLVNLGFIHGRNGDLAAALRYDAEAVELARGGDDEITVAGRLLNLAHTEHLLGHLVTSERHHLEGLGIMRRCQDRYGEAGAHVGLAQLYADWNRLGPAMTHACAAMDAARGPQPKLATEGLLVLGEVQVASGHPGLAIPNLSDAAARAAAAGDPLSRSMALQHLSHAHRSEGRAEEAERAGSDALELAQHSGFRLQEGEAAAALAAVHVATGRPADAVGLGRHAAATLTETGYRLGAARAHRVLGDAYALAGDADLAERARRRADRIAEACLGIRS